MPYLPTADRYGKMVYRRTGKSGLLLPAISLGLWNNFGHNAPAERSRRMLFTAFDLGITHFDLANNYGPPPGSAEEFFGSVMQSDFRPYRDEMVISTKAGWGMWEGPYGDLGSRKYLLASLDQSLKRMKLDYVDIFYSHRPDPATPIEETMGALDTVVRQGKALYVGISSYSNKQTKDAAAALRKLGTPPLIHQPRYNMFDRWTEKDKLLDRLEAEGMGCIAFSPLAQGVLTDRYLDGIPADSRAAVGRFLHASSITKANVARVRALKAIAERRGQTLAQMALAWVLRDPRMTSALIGASRPEHVQDAVGALSNLKFSKDELAKIEPLAVDGALNG
jgi:L-glyceraldehyde 3-phosphate reductase